MKFAESLETHRQSFLEALHVRSYSKATLETHRGSLGTFFRYLIGLGIEDLRSVDRETIRDYQLWLSSRGYTTWTKTTKLEGLRRFFEYLEKTDAVLINPCESLVLAKAGERLPKKIFTREEARKILDQPDTQTRCGIRDKAILELFYSTGIRLSEMWKLTIYDVDYTHGFLRINQGKFAKDRVVPMGKRACHSLREYITKVRSQWSKENRDERALWLIGVRPYRAIDKQAISVYMRNYIREAGLSGSAHTWRHTCASHMVSTGANIAYVQRLLGHRSLRTTQVYTRVTALELKQTLKRFHPRS